MNNLETALSYARKTNREIWVAVGLLGMAVINNQRAAERIQAEIKQRDEEVRRSARKAPKADRPHYDAESTAEEVH